MVAEDPDLDIFMCLAVVDARGMAASGVQEIRIGNEPFIISRPMDPKAVMQFEPMKMHVFHDFNEIRKVLDEKEAHLKVRRAMIEEADRRLKGIIEGKAAPSGSSESNAVSFPPPHPLPQ